MFVNEVFVPEIGIRHIGIGECIARRLGLLLDKVGIGSLVLIGCFVRRATVVLLLDRVIGQFAPFIGKEDRLVALLFIRIFCRAFLVLRGLFGDRDIFFDNRRMVRQCDPPVIFTDKAIGAVERRDALEGLPLVRRTGPEKRQKRKNHRKDAHLHPPH